MCGRYTLSKPGQVLAEVLEIDQAEAEQLCEDMGLAPRFNVAPSQALPIVRAGEQRDELCAELALWGLTGGEAGSEADGQRDRAADRPKINARAETIAVLPSFAEPFRRRRCLVPADGFFEWRKVGQARQPYYFRPREGGALRFAGLFNLGADETALSSYCLVTTAAQGCVLDVHGRMPVMLDREASSIWLDPASRYDDLTGALGGPGTSALLESFPVSDDVNRAVEDSARLLDPVQALPENLSLF